MFAIVYIELKELSSFVPFDIGSSISEEKLKEVFLQSDNLSSIESQLEFIIRLGDRAKLGIGPSTRTWLFKPSPVNTNFQVYSKPGFSRRLPSNVLVTFIISLPGKFALNITNGSTKLILKWK
jgi:hypothetical protein